MSKTDPGLAPRLAAAPTYQQALRGQWWAPGLPQTPGYRAINLREAAQADGIDIPSGYAFDEKKGEFYDANADHWYSDPRVLGPIAVGAAGGVGALAGGGAAASGGASTAGMGAGEVALSSSALPAGSVGTGVAGAMNGSGGGMGIGSILGWLGKGSDAMSAIGNVGEVVAGAGKGSADQRMAENDAALRAGLLRNQQAADLFTSQLKGAEFQRTNQDRERKAAILSALLSNTQDQSITPGNPKIAARMPTVTGGARPSNLTNSKDALLALLSQAGPQAPVYQSPGMPELEEGGLGEDILGGLGLGTSILGAIGRGKPKNQLAR